MPLVSIKDELCRAQREHYAVPLFDVFEMRAVEGIFETLEELQTPAILAIHTQCIDLPNAKAFSAFIRTMAEDSTVPVSLMLDHGASAEQCAKALTYGFSDVMYDGSALPFEENIAATRLIARLAHAVGAAVEGELGHVGRGADYQAYGAQRKGFTDPSLVRRFVEESGVDCLAIAIGNAHGLYKTTPKLDSQRVTDIVSAVPVPIALHGGTGMTNEQFKDLIARGCSKVNISTALKMNYMQSNLAFLRQAEADNKWDPPTLFNHVRQSVIDMVKGYLRTFGSVGKA